MKTLISTAIIAVALAASPAFAKSGVKTGVLSCDVSAGIGMLIGSSKAVSCTFKHSNGHVET